ncbi:MAG: M42 family peptidase [Clostridia bacterium]|nr:M42 family peptidase [Clostridia bacterium]
MNKDFLFEMLRTGSVSGNEAELEKKIYDYMQDKADVVTVDELGCVTAAVNPDAAFKVLLAGHADEIGLMVSAIGSDGTLMVTRIGGIYATAFPGHKVRVYTKNGVIYGAVANSRDIAKNRELEASGLRIDIGAKDREDAQKYVELGDTVTFDTDVRELLNDCICGRALDDRLGAFIVMEALAEAKKRGASVGCYAVSTTGEETTGNGAYFTASRVRPNIAIAVDVTYTSDNCGISEAESGDVSVGKGPVICNNPSIHKKVNERLRACAAKLKMEVQTEAASGRTGTDGDIMHRTGIGVPFALVSIPLRYMHNPAEVGSLRDVQGCIDLLAEFFVSCTADMELKPF